MLSVEQCSKQKSGNSKDKNKYLEGDSTPLEVQYGGEAGLLGS